MAKACPSFDALEHIPGIVYGSICNLYIENTSSLVVVKKIATIIMAYSASINFGIHPELGRFENSGS